MNLYEFALVFIAGMLFKYVALWTYALVRDEWRDYKFHKHTFKIQAAIDTLESTGWRLIPPPTPEELDATLRTWQWALTDPLDPPLSSFVQPFQD